MVEVIIFRGDYMFKFDFNKEYVFSYLFYEIVTGESNEDYHKLSGRKVEVINENKGYVTYKGKIFYVTPPMTLEIKREHSI